MAARYGTWGESAALAEWEGNEALKGPPRQAAALLGVSVRTIYRYRSRRWTCAHCGQQFFHGGAAKDHFLGRDR
jgi:hypothetical protein